MKEISVKGIIYVLDELNVQYSVCSIEQIHYEDDTFKYLFKPFYNIIDMLKPSFFQGIPGLNLELRKAEYIRVNKTPTFIYERTPQENRQDLWELLDEAAMKYLDKLEWLIRTDKKYTGDSLMVERYSEGVKKYDVRNIVYNDKINVNSIEDIGKNNFEILGNLLQIIAKGAYLTTDDYSINDTNRSEMYSLIYPLYSNEYKKMKNLQREGIQQTKRNHVYRGRKKINVSPPKLEEVIERMKSKDITEKEGMEILGLKSRSTFYRRIREFKKENLQ